MQGHPPHKNNDNGIFHILSYLFVFSILFSQIEQFKCMYPLEMQLLKQPDSFCSVINVTEQNIQFE